MKLQIITILLGALLTACTPSVAIRSASPLVITRTKYIPVDLRLTRTCDKNVPPFSTWGGAVQSLNSVYANLLSCAAQVDGIRKVEKIVASGK